MEHPVRTYKSGFLDLSIGRASERGFSFTELLFAVMILGIGFIMIAAIFPVGLSQTKANFDETIAATTARAGVAILQRDAVLEAYPDTGGEVRPIQTLAASLRSSIAESNMVLPSDPRYAWVGLYRRMATVTGPSRQAQVFVVVTNRQDPFRVPRSGTLNDDFDVWASSGVRPLEPRRVGFDIIGGVLTLRSPPSPSSGEAFNVSAAAPGAYLVVAVDALGVNPDITDSNDRARSNGKLNGRVYRLGGRRGASNDFDLQPGADFTNESFGWDHDNNVMTDDRVVSIPSLKGAEGYIIGRNRVGDGDEFEGPAMDVAFYTSFISLK